MMSTSEISEFFMNRKVFITGSTGFMGKLLIEKLLRSTDVAVIYILLREKRGETPSERLSKMLNNEIFEKLRNYNPQFKSRITAISGDVNVTNLGLSPTDYEELILNVDVVFHLAAAVRFNENLKSSYNINVGGTRNLMVLSKQMKNLKSFVHVSTAFTYCNVNFMDEIFYDSVDYKQIQNSIESLSESEIGPLTQSILKNSPTTYNFTKTLAELLIRDHAEDLPIGIFRPSIVTSTYKEPTEGWTDSLGGAAVISVGGAMGLIRVVPCNVDLLADLVPADMTIAALIACAWNINKKRTPRTDEIPIYNYVSSTDNPITWHEYHTLTEIQYLAHYPLSAGSLLPNYIITTNLSVFRILTTIFHYLPAALIDLCSVICFKKPRMLSRYRRLDDFMPVAKYACLTKRTYTNNNVKKMWNEMNEKDRELFPFDVKMLNWLRFFRSYFKGIRMYLFKDPLNTIPSTKQRLQRFKTGLYFISILVYLVGLYGIMVKLLSPFSRVTQSIKFEYMCKMWNMVFKVLSNGF